MTTALIYNGVLIHDRGEMLCLTDMWRAAGSDANKAPAIWRRQEATEQFVSYIAGTMTVDHSDLFQAINGGSNPGTWAHWQIAFAYAKYLSPEFHAWCNEVVRAHMEGRSLVPAPPITLDGLRAVLRQEIAPVQSQVNRMERKDEDHQAQLNRIERKQDDLTLLVTSKRKKLTAAEERILDRYALASGRLCGCCRQRFVVDPEGNRLPNAATDHAFANQTANVNANSVTCQLICSSANGQPRSGEYCHDKLTSGEMPREMVAHRFTTYADLLREFIARENGPAPTAQPIQLPQQELALPDVGLTRADRICSAIYFTYGNDASIAEIGACGIATDGKDALASVRNGILRQLEGSTEHSKPPWNAKPTLFQLADVAMKGRLGVRYSCTAVGIEVAKRVGPLSGSTPTQRGGGLR